MQYLIEDTSLIAIADRIRARSNIEDEIPLLDMPAAVEHTYNYGFTEGQEAEQDRWWNDYQKEGTRVDYNYAYGGAGWDNQSFRPKYNMQPTKANYMFHESKITNLKALLQSLDIILDFSKCTAMTYPFQGSQITHLGVLDTRKVSSLEYVMTRATKLISVDRFLMKEDGSQKFQASLSFAGLSELVNIIFEGTIGQANFNMKDSKKLSKASITSIINCLSTTTSGLAITLSLEAVNKAFEQYPNWNDGSVSPEWLALINTRTNWTISLV